MTTTIKQKFDIDLNARIQNSVQDIFFAIKKLANHTECDNLKALANTKWYERNYTLPEICKLTNKFIMDNNGKLSMGRVEWHDLSVQEKMVNRIYAGIKERLFDIPHLILSEIENYCKLYFEFKALVNRADLDKKTVRLNFAILRQYFRDTGNLLNSKIQANF